MMATVAWEAWDGMTVARVSEGYQDETTDALGGTRMMVTRMRPRMRGMRVTRMRQEIMHATAAWDEG